MMYLTRRIFDRHASGIRRCMEKWGVSGFRSPSMHRRLDWLHALNIEYDLSTFDTDPFEPQPDGVNTIFPFWIPHRDGTTGYVEIPYTLPQDFTLFIILKENSIDIWKQKLDWVASHGGMALLNTHPDYMALDGEKCGAEQFPVQYYHDFLTHIKEQYKFS